MTEAGEGVPRAAGGTPTGVLIVDDEAPARSVLREMLSNAPGVRILAECANGFEAVKAAVELAPDVVFLDIEMPKLDGFEVALLLDPKIAVVFVTAYDSHALKAFEVQAVDYVLKPFRPERLAAALERARARSAPPVDRGDLAAAARPPGPPLARIAVRDGSRVHLIPVDKLDLVEARDDYVSLKSEGRKYRKQQTIGSLAAALDPGRFVRVHRSFIVNVDRLARLELYAKGSYVAVLADGSKIPVSREGHSRLKTLLEGGPSARP